MRLIDHHCHLDFPDLAADEAGVVARARAAGLAAMITIGTRVRDFARVQAIAHRHHDVFCSIGTHPHNAGEERDVRLEEIVGPALADERIVAIGEAGLDYFYDKAPRADQEAGFRRHIEAARRTGLPLVIHTRDAEADTARILDDEMAAGRFDAVLHCYTGGMGLAMTALALGLYVSFSGVLTFKKSDALREVAAAVPLDRLLVETDAPYLAPEPHRGRRNEPAFVVGTARRLAEVKGVSPEVLAAATLANTLRLYGRLPDLSAGAPPAGRGEREP